jgi:hypothetical protein
MSGFSGTAAAAEILHALKNGERERSLEGDHLSRSRMLIALRQSYAGQPHSMEIVR